METAMNKQRASQLYELADRLSKLDVNTLSEEQLAERSTMISKLQEQAKGMSRAAKAGREGAGEEKLDQIRDKHNKYSDPVEEGYTVTPGIDRERYQARDGLEGPFSTKSGKVVYYDKVEGKYYDPDTDMYIEYADWQAMNESNGEYDDEAGMAQSNLHTMARAVAGLIKTIESNDNLPEWAQEKIAKAEMMVTSVWDYLLSQKEQGMDPKVQGVAEGQETPESELERLKLRQNAEHGGASLQRQSETQARIRELEKQIKDKKSVAEAKKPSPKLTPVNIKKTDTVSEEINTEAYERLQKVFAFKNYES